MRQVAVAVEDGGVSVNIDGPEGVVVAVFGGKTGGKADVTVAVADGEGAGKKHLF